MSENEKDTEPEVANAPDPVVDAWKFMAERDAAGEGYYESNGHLGEPIIYARMYVNSVLEEDEPAMWQEAEVDWREYDAGGANYELADLRFRLANQVIFNRKLLDEAKERYLKDVGLTISRLLSGRP